MKQIEIRKWATLAEILALLVKHGGDALLQADGIEPYVDGLSCGHMTIWPSERHLYGDESTWDIWEAFRRTHGATLRTMTKEYLDRIMRENDELVRATTPCADYFSERG